jgi:serine/threonine protein phosphatase PrpC
MVVDALNSVAPTASLNAALESVNVALAGVNADLRRGALGIGRDDRAGSTVVALAIRGTEWGVLWAGDSRAYMYRSGSLTQITRDHTVASETGAESGHSLAALVAAGDEITRAVGGDEVLELDYTSGLVVDRDRFLLCTVRSATFGWPTICSGTALRKPAGRWSKPRARPVLSTM